MASASFTESIPIAEGERRSHAPAGGTYGATIAIFFCANAGVANPTTSVVTRTTRNPKRITAVMQSAPSFSRH